MAAFLDSGARACAVATVDALGDPVQATYARDGDTAIVEMAAASGLALLGERRAALDATTEGTGIVLRDAVNAGARRLICAIGGSATTDGGAGALHALGVRFLDAGGAELAPSPRALERLAAIDAAALVPALRDVTIAIACDVDNPLLGPGGAAAIYGPQKGASPADVAFLDRVLAHFADLASDQTGRDLREMPGAGAAGGLGFGLATFTNARLAAGFAIVAEQRGFARALAGCALCITGEGRIDAQSLSGKVVSGVAAAAATARVPVLAIAGSVDAQTRAALQARGVTTLALAETAAERTRAMADAPGVIRAVTARWARSQPVPA